MSNTSLDDEEKERILKQVTVHLLKQFAKIAILGGVIICLPLLVLQVLDILKIVQFQEVINFTLKWEVIVVTTACAVAVSTIRR